MLLFKYLLLIAPVRLYHLTCAPLFSSKKLSGSLTAAAPCPSHSLAQTEPDSAMQSLSLLVEPQGPLAMPRLPGGCGAALSFIAKRVGGRKEANTDVSKSGPVLAVSTHVLWGMNACSGQYTAKSPSQQSPGWPMEESVAPVLPVQPHWGSVGGKGLCCSRELWPVLPGNGIHELEAQLCMEGSLRPASRTGARQAQRMWSVCSGVFVYSAHLEHHCHCKSSVLLTEQIVPTNKE